MPGVKIVLGDTDEEAREIEAANNERDHTLRGGARGVRPGVRLARLHAVRPRRAVPGRGAEVRRALVLHPGAEGHPARPGQRLDAAPGRRGRPASSARASSSAPPRPSPTSSSSGGRPAPATASTSASTTPPTSAASSTSSCRCSRSAACSAATTTATTLRGHLGLPVPANRYAAAGSERGYRAAHLAPPDPPAPHHIPRRHEVSHAPRPHPHPAIRLPQPHHAQPPRPARHRPRRRRRLRPGRLRRWHHRHGGGGAGGGTGTITWAWQLPTTWDPVTSSAGSDVQMLALTYDALTALDDTGNAVGWLAESWKYNDDGTEVTFTLALGAEVLRRLAAQRRRGGQVDQPRPHPGGLAHRAADGRRSRTSRPTATSTSWSR